MVHDAVPSPTRHLSVALVLLIALAAPSFANEVMTDRCSGDVAFPPTYDTGPGEVGTMFVTRGGAGGTRWSPSIRQQIDGDGHIRWYCHSTTGNWADPGTWTIDNSGGTYNCDPDNNCTLSVNASGHPVDVNGWTAERSRCDNHSNTFRAILGQNRLLQIECLGSTGQVSQRLIGAPTDISSGGFGNAPLPKIAIRPVQHAPLEAWNGNFVYKRGGHLNDSQLVLSIRKVRAVATTTASHLMGSAYDVSISEKTNVPFALGQRVTLAGIAVRGQAPFVKDYLAPRVAVGTHGPISAHMLHAPLVPPTHPVPSTGGTPSGGMHIGRALSPGSRENAAAHVSVSPTTAAQPGRFLEWADTMMVSPDVSLMLYVVSSKNQPVIGYAVRYIRRGGGGTLTDVMMTPPVEQPH